MCGCDRRRGAGARVLQQQPIFSDSSHLCAPPHPPAALPASQTAPSPGTDPGQQQKGKKVSRSHLAWLNQRLLTAVTNSGSNHFLHISCGAGIAVPRPGDEPASAEDVHQRTVESVRALVARRVVAVTKLLTSSLATAQNADKEVGPSSLSAAAAGPTRRATCTRVRLAVSTCAFTQALSGIVDPGIKATHSLLSQMQNTIPNLVRAAGAALVSVTR